MAIAVGSGERIAAVLPELGSLLTRPLITLERVQVCKRDGQLIERPHPLPAVDRQGRGVWQKISIHTSESTLFHGEPIHRALIRRLRRSSTVRGATAVRGIWGFHGDHRPHGDRLLQVGRRVPVVTIIVDRPDRIARCFDIVDDCTAGARARDVGDGPRGAYRRSRRGSRRSPTRRLRVLTPAQGLYASGSAIRSAR